MYKISEELLNKILNVLASLPYAQVATLITEIQSGVQKIETPIKPDLIPSENQDSSTAV